MRTTLFVFVVNLASLAVFGERFVVMMEANPIRAIINTAIWHTLIFVIAWWINRRRMRREITQYLQQHRSTLLAVAPRTPSIDLISPDR